MRPTDYAPPILQGVGSFWEIALSGMARPEFQAGHDRRLRSSPNRS